MKTPQHCKQSQSMTLSSSTIHSSGAQQHALVLPNDVVHEILSQFEKERKENPTPMHYTYTIFQPTLFALSLLNKEWNAEAAHRLYKDVFIHSSRCLSVFVHTLLRRQDLCAHVQSFFFLRVRADRLSREYNLLDGFFHIERRIGLVFGLCPKLQFKKPATSYLWTTAHSLVQERNTLDASNVTRLELNSILQPLSQMLGTAPSFPSLEELIVTGAARGFRVQESGWPDMPRLRRLCLLGCSFVTDDAPLTLPRCSDRLHTLEIIGGEYNPGVFWIEARSLANHIEHLALLSTSLTMSALFEGQLNNFPFLSSLRMMVTDAMGGDGVSVPLPLQVAHLTIVADKYTIPSVTWNVEEAVRKQVKAKRGRRRRVDCRWETVLFAGIPAKHVRMDQKIIQIMAKQVGVKFTESFSKEGSNSLLDEAYVVLFRY